MATTIVTKNGSGVPLDTDLVQGELAIDLVNKRIYSKDPSDEIIQLGSDIDIPDGVNEDDMLLWSNTDDKWTTSEYVPSTEFSTSPPVNPKTGMLWQDTTPDEQALYCWDGSAWFEIVGANGHDGGDGKQIWSEVTEDGDIYYDKGNVGIGVSGSPWLLHARSDSGPRIRVENTTDAQASFDLKTGTRETRLITDPDYILRVYDQASNSDKLSIDASGNVTVKGGLLAAKADAGDYALAVGYLAGYENQGADATAVGEQAGYEAQGFSATAVGQYAGSYRQTEYAVAVGHRAGMNDQGASSVAIGEAAGQTNQSADALAIGKGCGFEGQGQFATALGRNAGSSSQGNSSVAIGYSAAETTQGDNAIAVGKNAGRASQGFNGIAVGNSAGYDTQGDYSVAVGNSAGKTSQGANSIAIGTRAGETSQAANGIIINSSGIARNETAPGHIFITSTTGSLAYNGSNQWTFYGGTVTGGGLRFDTVTADNIVQDGAPVVDSLQIIRAFMKLRDAVDDPDSTVEELRDKLRVAVVDIIDQFQDQIDTMPDLEPPVVMPSPEASTQEIPE